LKERKSISEGGADLGIGEVTPFGQNLPCPWRARLSLRFCQAHSKFIGALCQ
jgi:hypothetical protein